MVSISNLVFQQDRRAIVGRDQHIHRAIIIEVPQSQSSRREWFCKNRSALCGHVAKGLSIVMEKKKRFAKSNLRLQFLDQIVRMSVRNHQIHIAIIVVIEKLE